MYAYGFLYKEHAL